MEPFDKLKKMFDRPKDTSFPNELDKKMAKMLEDAKPKQMISNIKMDSAGQITGNITNIGMPTANTIGYNYTTAMTSAAAGYIPGTITTAVGGGYYSGVNMGGTAMQSPPPPAYTVKYTNPMTNKEIVRVNPEGKVIWADDIEIDEAAEAFSKALSIGAELKAGITERVKRDMRDSIFEDIIEIAKQKGSLNAEDLTYLLQAAKIMEKLKGGK